MQTKAMNSSLRIPTQQPAVAPVVEPSTTHIIQEPTKPCLDFSGGSAKWNFDKSSLQKLANWLDNTSPLRKTQCVSVVICMTHRYTLSDYYYRDNRTLTF